MAPTRTRDSNATGETSSAAHHKTKKRRSITHNETSTPGVQKLKSSLRQTRRLLAKDNVAADLRVETERRLKALEADLARAEASRKERSLAVRYHKIKFFERQKIVRKINQTKKGISTSPDGSEMNALESSLSELRVDLNYILHFPKTKKYISLFPPEIRQGHTESKSSNSEAGKVEKEREEVREWIRKQMKNGELSAEPEVNMKAKDGADARDENRATWNPTKDAKKKAGVKKSTKSSFKASDVTSDAFFVNDSDGGNDDYAEDDDDE